MTTDTEVRPYVGQHSLLEGVHINSTELREIRDVAGAVVLLVSGALVGVYLSHEVGAGLVAAGIHTLVTVIEGHRSAHPNQQASTHPSVPAAAPNLAVGFA